MSQRECIVSLTTQGTCYAPKTCVLLPQAREKHMLYDTGALYAGGSPLRPKVRC